MTYPLYAKDNRCSKCGETGASTAYHIEIISFNTPERMGRACVNCGHCWFEAPLDSITPADTPPEPTQEKPKTLEELVTFLVKRIRTDARCHDCLLETDCAKGDFGCDPLERLAKQLGIEVGV